MRSNLAWKAVALSGMLLLLVFAYFATLEGGQAAFRSLPVLAAASGVALIGIAVSQLRAAPDEAARLEENAKYWVIKLRDLGNKLLTAGGWLFAFEIILPDPQWRKWLGMLALIPFLAGLALLISAAVMAGPSSGNQDRAANVS